MLADGGFARAHHADQNNGLVQFHAECALVICNSPSFHGLRLHCRDIATKTKGKPPMVLATVMRGQPEGTNRLMKYLLRLIFILVLLAVIAVVAFAYVGDMSPQRAPVSTPLQLEPQ